MTTPPTEPPRDALEDEIATMLVRIEINYYREGTGYGSRFAVQRLEVVQARAVIKRLRWEEPREADVIRQRGYDAGYAARLREEES